MRDGFIKVAAGSVRVGVADPEANAALIIERARQAERYGVHLLVLPELCLAGCTCQDLFSSDALIRAVLEALGRILDASQALDAALCLGLPLRGQGRLYDCAAVIRKGKLLGLVPRAYPAGSPFSPAPQGVRDIELLGQTVPFGAPLVFRCGEMADFAFGVEIGGDAWAPDPPARALAQAGANIIACPSASNEQVGRADARRLLARSSSARLLCGYVLADACETESTQDMVFSGHRLIAEGGDILAESPPFTPGDMTVTEIDCARLAALRRKSAAWPGPAPAREIVFSHPLRETALTRPIAKNPFVPENAAELSRRAEEILRTQSWGLKKRLEHTGAKTVVVGVSGGLDSCLALLTAARTMDLCARPRADILAVTMPGFGTTRRTHGNAQDMCRLLGVGFREIDIQESVRLHFRDIGHDEVLRNVTYENAQARERTQVLMDLANETGGLVLGTGDLSELALGWATFNGDHMSMYGVNASVPKTLVRHLVRYEAGRLGGELGRVLIDVLDTPVSPELLPADGQGQIAQKTEDLMGPYELHDFFLYYALRLGFGPRKIYRLARRALGGDYGEDAILKWLRVFFRRFFSQQFKRSCLPDGVKVGSVSLSPRGDWRMPSDASAKAWMEEVEALEGESEGLSAPQTP